LLHGGAVEGSKQFRHAVSSIVPGSHHRTLPQELWWQRSEAGGWQVCTLTGHTEPVTKVEFSDDGAQAISGSHRDGTVRGAGTREGPGGMMGVVRMRPWYGREGLTRVGSAGTLLGRRVRNAGAPGRSLAVCLRQGPFQPGQDQPARTHDRSSGAGEGGHAANHRAPPRPWGASRRRTKSR